MNRYWLKVKRKRCRKCASVTPHKDTWYEGIGATCPFWEANKGMCGCSAYDPAGPEYPSTPCHGGYQHTWTCCKCKTTKRKLEKGWVECDDLWTWK